MQKVNLIFLLIMLCFPAFPQFQLKGRFIVDVKNISDTSTCSFFLRKEADLTDTNRLIKTLIVKDINSDFPFSFDSLAKGRYTLIIQGFVYALFIENLFLNNDLDIGCFKSNFTTYNARKEGDKRGERKILRKNENGITKEYDITNKRKINVEFFCCLGLHNSVKLKYKHDFIFIDYRKLPKCKAN